MIVKAQFNSHHTPKAPAAEGSRYKPKKQHRRYRDRSSSFATIPPLRASSKRWRSARDDKQEKHSQRQTQEPS
jgi:hypothetical protein